jgi:hypothetical protein
MEQSATVERCSFVFWTQREIRVFCANPPSSEVWMDPESVHAALLVKLAEQMGLGRVD